MLASTPANCRPRPTRQPGPFPLQTLPPSAPGEHCLRSALEQAIVPAFAIGPDHLWIHTRGSPPAAFARQVAMYLAHVSCGLTFTQVGHLFARDRTTVAHACIVVEDRRDEVPFDRALDLLEGAMGLLSPRLS
jgi:hypothetical protein